jgi:hypothetical protein
MSAPSPNDHVIHFCAGGVNGRPCPGYSFAASKLAHPAATCGSSTTARMDSRTESMPRTAAAPAKQGVCQGCAFLRAENERLRAALANGDADGK